MGENGATGVGKVFSNTNMKRTNGAADVGGRATGAFKLVDTVIVKAQAAGGHLAVREAAHCGISATKVASEVAGTVVDAHR